MIELHGIRVSYFDLLGIVFWVLMLTYATLIWVHHLAQHHHPKA